MGAWIAALLMAGSFLASGSACKRSSTEGKVEQDITITKADFNRTVKVAAGGRITLRLSWSPGTGYDWTVAKIDGARLQQEGEAGTEPNPAPMPGAPETRIFQFRALKAGSTALELHSRRIWEKDVPPSEVFKVQVAIGD